MARPRNRPPSGGGRQPGVFGGLADIVAPAVKAVRAGETTAAKKTTAAVKNFAKPPKVVAVKQSRDGGRTVTIHQPPPKRPAVPTKPAPTISIKRADITGPAEPASVKRAYNAAHWTPPLTATGKVDFDAVDKLAKSGHQTAKDWQAARQGRSFGGLVGDVSSKLPIVAVPKAILKDPRHAPQITARSIVGPAVGAAGVAAPVGKAALAAADYPAQKLQQYTGGGQTGLQQAGVVPATPEIEHTIGQVAKALPKVAA